MTTRAAQLDDLRAEISRMIDERLDILPRPQEATIIGSTYEPEGSVAILFGDTYSLLGDDGDAYIPHPQLPLVTTQIGDQHGPIGNERVVALPTPTGYALMLVHGPDDAPGAPAGERWILHRAKTSWASDTPTWDAGLKHTNDGPTAGDGLGGAEYGVGGALTTLTTKSGHVVALNDTAKTVTATSAGGHSVALNDAAKTVTITTAGGHTVTLDDNTATKGVTVKTAGGMLAHFDDVKNAITHAAQSTIYTIVDGAGKAISHVASQVGLGALFSTLTSDEAAVNHSVLSTFGGNINTANLQSLVNLGNAMVTAGIPNASALVPLIVASLISNVSIPPGSASVRITS